MPPFFSNLLPEGHLRTYLAERAGVNEPWEFFLLAALGADLPGAVTVEPLDGDPFGEGVPAAGDGGDGDRPVDRALRFSLAGMQLKFSALVEASGGLTIPARGAGGSWVVKLPSTRFEGVPENEYVMLELARAVGIEVPPVRLVELSEISGIPREVGRLEGRALAIKRFDRGPGGERIHMEDFTQVFGLWPHDKYAGKSYADIAAVLRAEAGRRQDAPTFAGL